MKITAIGTLAMFLGMAALPRPLSAETPDEHTRNQLVQIKQRIVEDLTCASLPAGSPERNQYLATLDAQADELLAVENGYWSRYRDANDPRISHNGGAFGDVFTLACAFSSRGSRYYRSSTASQAIEQGLRHFLGFVHAGCPKPHNWWAWDIGIPMHLTRTLLLVEDGIEPELLQAELDTLTYLLKVSEDVGLEEAPGPPEAPYQGRTDMNALWHARLRMQYAVLIENPAMAVKWARRAFGEIAPPGEGSWQADFSYKFHGQNPMWTYGNVFIHDYGMLLGRYRGTAFGPSESQLRLFGTMVEHYYEGFLYRGRISPAIIGRTLSRRSNPQFDVHGPLALTALSALARTDHPDAKRYAALVQRDAPVYHDLDIHQSRVNVAIRQTPVVDPAPPTDDIFAYPDSDFMQITRPGWAIGIKLHSTRNAGYESINRENLQGWFLSHGSTFHYIEGTEWDGCWPTLDWTRLPGTTATPDCKGGNESAFAGVVRGSRRSALAAMELKSEAFRARKSWLVNGDHVVCLGSGIAGPGRVETTVFNQPVEPGSPLVVDGRVLPEGAFHETVHARWCWTSGMGYVFPGGADVLALRETRTSDYSSIRGPALHGRGETSTREYLTGVIAHDEQPASYAYVIIPEVRLEAMPAWADRVTRRYDLNTGGAHVARWSDGTLQSAVFWGPDSAGETRVDRACLLLREAGRWMLVDPTWSGAEVYVCVGEKRYRASPKKGRPVVLAEDAAP